MLLFSSAAGLYWAGVVSTFVMALGTALTVSAIAALASVAFPAIHFITHQAEFGRKNGADWCQTRV